MSLTQLDGRVVLHTVNDTDNHRDTTAGCVPVILRDAGESRVDAPIFFPFAVNASTGDLWPLAESNCRITREQSPYQFRRRPSISGTAPPFFSLVSFGRVCHDVCACACVTYIGNLAVIRRE